MNKDARIQADFNSLLDLARGRCRSEEELDLVRTAFKYAREAHKGFSLGGGEPFILHPLEVAKIVVGSIGLGCKSICAALLHDVPKNTDTSPDQLRPLFGDKIASLVDGLNNIRSVLESSHPLSEEDSDAARAENFKRVLLSMGGDIRVVLIKLADRLENCRRLDTLPPGKADRILAESKSLFIPLAHRLGLYGIKSEMENIWLKHRQPQDYAWIENRVNRDILQRSRDIDEFIAPINSALEASGITFQIKKRIKTPYSIWHKMRTKGVSFEQIYDLYAVRIVFECDARDIETERKRAFEIYTLVTSLYPQNQSRMRDWINQPKENGYEALHCTLMSKAGIWVEVQIRSRRMDDIAEKGIAAHWNYKKDGYLSEDDTNMDRWLAKVQEILSSRDADSLELLEIIQEDIAAKTISVFTPVGEQKSIPKGSTALDFAYYVHTNVGNQAIAAKINSKLAPLSRQLRAGDQVEIITARKSTPKPEWLEFLHTRHARRRLMDSLKGSPDPDALRRAEEIMNTAPTQETFTVSVKLTGTRRPGLQEDIENALRHIDGIEDVVNCML
ncbi:MAG: bifunctional (p)ppGpp synthetase/guanosine-3',5'-bis(diphosphate) 3'-pyrophosphohydrolase [Bacteroidales bacterium]|nr:bifunctional (p)ppGpp synthetase/guanosine-3',5'-bis(diphosphate) 3'-pyrophosphohydrolase [Bacteroidales bacterium]